MTTMDSKLCESALKIAKSYVYQETRKLLGMTLSDEQKEHVSNMVYSALQTKYKFGYSGGSFIKAVADNNLVESVIRADSINLKLLPVIAVVLNSITLKDIMMYSETEN